MLYLCTLETWSRVYRVVRFICWGPVASSQLLAYKNAVGDDVFFLKFEQGTNRVDHFSALNARRFLQARCIVHSRPMHPEEVCCVYTI